MVGHLKGLAWLGLHCSWYWYTGTDTLVLIQWYWYTGTSVLALVYTGTGYWYILALVNWYTDTGVLIYTGTGKLVMLH